ncbi:recombinase family protein [Fictibacillus gelatini]|uniref:recombinase family protein n=1 Tax=Fictibacillus gelatini TaxID=225985 RepID=UPI00040FED60|nr:recombinase family protein [Fictibacillus gelatini]
MKVVAYIRVSTHEQAEEGYSIQAQKRRLEAYAVSQGWDLVHFYVDEGISAKDITGRPELKRMLKGVQEKAFDCVLVYKLDRLTRSVLDLHELINLFEKHDVKFKSATEVYDTTTATGRLFITLVAALAQWERENLGERVSFGMEQKAREGKWVVAIPPLGYDRDGDYLVINESEAAIVREIYNLYLSGIGISKMALTLNKRGLRHKSGKPFTAESLRYILSNPVYIGTQRHNYRVNKERYFENENVIPKIIDKNIYDQVQLIREKRHHAHPRRANSPYIFSGVVKCKRCGRPLNGSYGIARGKETYRYHCANRKLGLCDLPSIAQNFLEPQFKAFFDQWDNFEVLDEALTEEENKSANKKKIASIQKELKEIENRKSKWQYAWVNEMITDEDFKSRMKEENEKEKMLLSELEALDESKTTHNINISELLMDMKENWDNMSLPEKKQFVQMTVKEIVVDKVSTEKKPESVSIEVKFH